MNEIDSYIYGLLITDGYLCVQVRNRGHVSLELNEKDRDIIEKLHNIIPNSTIKDCIRNTHFKNNCHTVIFRNSRLEFRNKLISQGFPIKNKTFTATPPIVPYNKFHFWRGAIDGDGCIGIRKDYNRPFITFSTVSEILKNEYLTFIKEFFGLEKNINKDKRGMYNICIIGKDAVKIIRKLYIENSGLSIDRKQLIASKIDSSYE